MLRCVHPSGGWGPSFPPWSPDATGQTLFVGVRGRSEPTGTLRDVEVMEPRSGPSVDSVFLQHALLSRGQLQVTKKMPSLAYSYLLHCMRIKR